MKLKLTDASTWSILELIFQEVRTLENLSVFQCTCFFDVAAAESKH